MVASFAFSTFEHSVRSILSDRISVLEILDGYCFHRNEASLRADHSAESGRFVHNFACRFEETPGDSTAESSPANA